MQNIQLTIPFMKIKEIIIEPVGNGKHVVSIDIGLINNSYRCLSRIRLDANKSWSNANIELTDKMIELINEIVSEIQNSYLNEKLLELTEDYNDNPVN